MNMPIEEPTRPESWPDWKLERYLLGELPPETSRKIGESAASDPVLARRLSALRDEHAALRAAHPAEAMAAGIERRLRQAEAADASPASAATAPSASMSRAPRPAPAPAARPSTYPAGGFAAALGRLRESAARASDGFRRARFPVMGPAFAMLLVLAALPFTRFSPFRSGFHPEDASGEGERIKGLEPRLILHRKLSEGSLKLRSGEAARAGDLIQIQYESAGRAQGAVYSLDAEGRLTRHLPDSGDRSAALKGGGPVALGFAFELDAAAGWERFYFITSAKPFDLGGVEAALKRSHPHDARKAEPLPLPPELGQSQFILLKEPGT